MENPFKSGAAPLGPNDCWICPKESWNELADAVQKKLNTMVLGVKGSGKSALLSKFFTPDFFTKSHTENKLLIFSAVLSDTTSGDELCDLLIAELCSAAQKALSEAEYSVLEDYLQYLKEKFVPKMQFIYLCEWLSGKQLQTTKKDAQANKEIQEKREFPSLEKNYTLLLVMDAFEKFVSRPEITEDQHNMLRYLLERDIMFCVVATDYDLEKTSLPPHAQSSLFIQKFQTAITVGGFSLEDAKEFVAQKLPADAPVQLTEPRIKLLHGLTGGIPLLFEKGAHVMYNRLRKQPGMKKAEFVDELYMEVMPTIKDWFKFFTPEYNATLQTVFEKMPDNVERLQQFTISSQETTAFAAAPSLKKRGFWTECARFGNYTFNSLLLQRYAVRGYLPSIMTPAKEVHDEEAPGEKAYNVFISYKRRNPENKEEETKDAIIASELFDALSKERGLTPFLDKRGVDEAPTNDAFDAIDAALETAKALVLVCTDVAYLDSRYVYYEIDVYNKELRAGRKESGSVFVVVDMTKNEEDRMELKLPLGVRSMNRRNLRDGEAASIYQEVASKVRRQVLK